MSNSKKISAMSAKTALVDADQVPILDSETAVAAQKNKRSTLTSLWAWVLGKMAAVRVPFFQPALISPTELTIDAAGAITVTQGYHLVDTFDNDDIDTLVTISGGADGDELTLATVDPSRRVVLGHGDGNIRVWNQQDITLEETYYHAKLIRRDGLWGVVSVVSDPAEYSGIASVAEDTSPEAGGVFSMAGFQFRQVIGADVASATTTTFGTDGNYFTITGDVTIAGFAPLAVGVVVWSEFDEALTLAHDATSLKLLTGADINTEAGDVATWLEYASGDWQMLDYVRKDGTALVATSSGPLNKLDGTVDPGVNDDSGDGFSVLSRWANVAADREFVCLDATAGAAVWKETTVAPFTVADGSVTLAKIEDIATSRILGRATAGAGAPEELTLSQVLDLIGSAAEGDLFYRGESAWARLAADTDGQILTLASGLPSWADAALAKTFVTLEGAASSTSGKSPGDVVHYEVGTFRALDAALVSTSGIVGVIDEIVDTETAVVQTGGLWANTHGFSLGVKVYANVSTGALQTTATTYFLGWTVSATQILLRAEYIIPDVGAGEVSYFARNTAPFGWLKANGAAVSRTTYAGLFSAIGTTFGVGDGSTTFALPDLRGEFLRGWDDSRGVDTSRAFGSAQADELKSHTHAHPDSFTIVAGALAAGGAVGTRATGTTNATGGAETRPRNIALLACIKY